MTEVCAPNRSLTLHLHSRPLRCPHPLGCAASLCLVCLTLLASFFLPSHLSLKHVDVCTVQAHVQLLELGAWLVNWAIIMAMGAITL